MKTHEIEPFCWYRVVRDITDEFVMVYSDGSHKPKGDSWQPLYTAIALTQFERGDKVTDEMVNRFLCWRLPEDFRPDCGITFKPDYNERTPWPAKHEPVGTNLLSAEQARKMLEYVLGSDKQEEK